MADVSIFVLQIAVCKLVLVPCVKTWLRLQCNNMICAFIFPCCYCRYYKCETQVTCTMRWYTIHVKEYGALLLQHASK